MRYLDPSFNSKPSTKAYRDNYDKIFKKRKRKKSRMLFEDLQDDQLEVLETWDDNFGSNLLAVARVADSIEFEWDGSDCQAATFHFDDCGESCYFDGFNGEWEDLDALVRGLCSKIED